MTHRKSKFEGDWLNVRVTGLDGKHWEFYGTEDRAYVRYGVLRGRRMISVGHRLSHGFAPIQAALVMNRAHDTPLTDHQIVCLLVRKDMQKWDENKTKNRFRKIVRPREPDPVTHGP